MSVSLHRSVPGHLWRAGDAADTSGPQTRLYVTLVKLGHKRSSPTDDESPCEMKATVEADMCSANL